MSAEKQKDRLQNRRADKGLTFIELITVISIIVLVAAMAVVSFGPLSSVRLEAEAGKLISELCRVRERALSRHQNYTITFDTAGDSYRVYSESGDERQNNSLSADLTSVTDLFGSPDNQAVFYYPKGTAQDRIINLSYGGRISRKVRLFSQTGYVRMELN